MTIHEQFARARAIAKEWASGLWHGMIEHPATANIEKAAEDAEDELFFGMFADAFGIPSPVSYYTAELIPYVAEDFHQFERRMWDRESMIERAGQQYHF
jgi:hypothetical protein